MNTDEVFHITGFDVPELCELQKFIGYPVQPHLISAGKWFVFVEGYTIATVGDYIIRRNNCLTVVSAEAYERLNNG